MNWGYRLLVTFLVFGIGMIYLVYRSTRVEFELVDKDYYKNELRYQEVIDGVKRANALSEAVRVSQTNETISLQLPGEMKNVRTSGTVHFYCDYDAKKDRKFDLNADTNGLQVLDRKLISSGEYRVKISWNANGSNYYTETSITVI